jgi:hypothetical protein
MQREHVVMLAVEDLVADINDQLMALVIEPLARIVRIGRGFLQNGVCRDHLAWNQIFADAEVLKRALGLGTPKPIGWDFDFA